MIEKDNLGTIQAKYVYAWRFVDNPPLDCVNPHFKNRYASLAATLSEVRKGCSMADIAYVQKLVADGDACYLKSFVMDGEGNILELSSFPVTNVPNPQAFGSEMTYKKRQQAQADWGIVGEEDDDANAAAEPYTAPKGQGKPKAAKEPKNDRLAAVRALYKGALEAGITVEGIDSWLTSRFSCTASGMAGLDDAALKAVEEYLKGRIADMETLRAEAA